MSEWISVKDRPATIVLGRKIDIPKYTKEQAEVWVDEKCPTYTGIMATINNISFNTYGCFVDKLTEKQRDYCDKEASKIGLAWYILPSPPAKGE